MEMEKRNVKASMLYIQEFMLSLHIKTIICGNLMAYLTKIEPACFCLFKLQTKVLEEN